MMSNRLTMILLVAMMAIATTSVLSADFFNGEQCGVTAEDMFKPDFGAIYRVAGTDGCSLEGNTQSKCYCAPNLKDGDRTSPFTWQCGGGAVFGPRENKTCPVFATTEIPKNGDKLQCDPAIHPSGRPGNEVCGYSDCESGGDKSAICACVAPSNYAQGDGTAFWICLHSTCSCTKQEEAAAASAANSFSAIDMTILAGSALAGSIALL